MDKIKASYVNHMGDDLTVVNAARVSFGSDSDVLSQKDKKLINYLAKHKHYTPFEHCMLSVKVECPLYIRSQIHRHRTFSYNEISRRYTDENLRFYNPDYRKQHKSSKQCSDGEFDLLEDNHFKLLAVEVNKKAIQAYDEMIDSGVARELARGVLPQNLMTEFYMTGNLRNWAQFLVLRLDSHAQLEVQKIAKDVAFLIETKFPVAGKALLDNL